LSCNPGPKTDQVLVDVQGQTFSLNVIKSGQGTVTGTYSPAVPVQTNINCGSVCSSSYESGTTVTLTATPALGRIFTGWGGACSGKGSCVVVVNSAKTVYANFAIDPNYEEF